MLAPRRLSGGLGYIILNPTQREKDNTVQVVQRGRTFNISQKSPCHITRPMLTARIRHDSSKQLRVQRACSRQHGSAVPVKTCRRYRKQTHHHNIHRIAHAPRFSPPAVDLVVYFPEAVRTDYIAAFIIQVEITLDLARMSDTRYIPLPATQRDSAHSGN